jgi:hypothetical protein
MKPDLILVVKLPSIQPTTNQIIVTFQHRFKNHGKVLPVRIGFPRKLFFLHSTKLKCRLNFILFSSKFRCFDFSEFQIRCRNRNFDLGFGFNFYFRRNQNSDEISFWFRRYSDVEIGISISVLISTSESDSYFDSDIGVPMLVLYSDVEIGTSISVLIISTKNFVESWKLNFDRNSDESPYIYCEESIVGKLTI